ncbi:MAG: DUF2279 domain-containing protein, partial [Bacteroidota bacterium]
MKPLSYLLLCCCLCFLSTAATAQELRPKRSFLQPADSLSKKRTYFIGTAFTATYLSASIILWEAWYKDIGISRFHFFNDWKGWERMDKYGHLFTAYNESNWSMQGLQWAGVNRRKAMWIGAAIGTGLQLTIEVMDGFGEDWGFSVS